eukprot:2916660-Pyramimonas_sp.AAC.1
MSEQRAVLSAYPTERARGAAAPSSGAVRVEAVCAVLQHRLVQRVLGEPGGPAGAQVHAPRGPRDAAR